MYVYIPNSITLSKNSRWKRVIPDIEKYNQSQLDKLDTNTVFYDIFLDRSRKRLLGVGPRLFNLKKDIFPLTLFVNNKHVKYRLVQIKNLVFIESKQFSNRISETVKVDLRFKSFERTVMINWKRDEYFLSKSDKLLLTISTLQKNNNIQWISDWILWHRRLYNVRRVVLYDNGSFNQKELIENLHNLEPEVQIILVHWRFPHGVTATNKFCQHGSLNHCRLKFPISNGYCVNLDIDEYLVKPTNLDLLNFLNCKLRFPTPGAVSIQEFIIPNITKEKHNAIPRFFDFPYRFQNIGRTARGDQYDEFGRTKYIYRFDSVAYNAAHRTASEKDKQFSKRYSNFQKLIFFCKKIWKESTRKLLHRQSPRPRIDSFYATPSEIYFFHFFGLATFWNGKPRRLPTGLDESIHVEEPLIIQLATLARLTINDDGNQNSISNPTDKSDKNPTGLILHKNL